MIYTEYGSPLGRILLLADGSHLTGVYFSGQKYEPSLDPASKYNPDSGIFRDAVSQLGGYFAGKQRRFDLPLRAEGTPFQMEVWAALMEIPFGETATYGELAERIGRKEAARAVGAAVGRNPISIIVPCHRVIGRGGSLTGYAGGLERKRALLELEKPAADYPYQKG
ncbi:MAG: methylated-DNA--[protein]-cysteine S-methyltransferase [Desulfobacteraceae bacterium]|nr:methylated-DNA--[protein]-cysteine S-methyltransferase [Desulfobacteraceae bacterium]